MTRVAVSWSGGKDSCLACYKVLQKGLKVSCLLNFISKDGRCMSHGINSKLITIQSESIGIPLIQREVTWDTYEEEFKNIARKLKRMGFDGIVFGDIDIYEHLNWIIRVCNDVGILYIEPLWRLSREKILKEFVNAGFEAIVVSVKADIFGAEWLGRRIDENFIEDLQKLHTTCSFDICGEFGEYHTLVIDGPIFNKRINIHNYRKVLREDYWKRWLLEISDYSVVEKSSHKNSTIHLEENGIGKENL
jgi:uncharacterized protein (TIGR00290 family)